MKTQNNTQKTVNYQVKRMVLRGGAIIFSLALVSFTVSAQDFWKQFSINTTYEKMAMLLDDLSSEFESANEATDAINAELTSRSNNSADVFAIETEVEAGLELEAWMTSETNFGANSATITEETDDAMNLEDWMINNVNLGSRMVADAADAEPSLELEPWMTSEDNFSTDDRDAGMELEDWMIENKHFSNDSTLKEKPMQLEAWMANL